MAGGYPGPASAIITAGERRGVVLGSAHEPEVPVAPGEGARLEVQTVLRAVDEVLGYSGVRDGRVVVFFRQGGEALAAEIDLSARKVLKRTKLPRS
jgi:hypothetical protein